MIARIDLQPGDLLVSKPSNRSKKYFSECAIVISRARDTNAQINVKWFTGSRTGAIQALAENYILEKFDVLKMERQE